MFKKLLSLLLAMMMLLSVLVLASCGEDKDKDEETTMSPEDSLLEEVMATFTPEATAESYDKVDQYTGKDYGGYEFKFLNSESVYFMYIYLDPDYTGDVLDNACYLRNLEAEELLNITITEETKPYNDLASHAKNLILSDQDVYDAMYIPAAQLTPLISENLFYDLLEIEQLGLDNIWWDQPLITRNTVEGRLFYATSDLSLMAFEGVWCMYFNEDMMTDLNLEAPYQLALDQKWTFAEMQKYCSAAASLNGDSTFVFDVEGNSTYGLSNMTTANYMAYGMGVEFTSRDEEGKYYFTADVDPKFTNTWEQLIGFFGPDNGMTINATAKDLDSDGYYGVFMDNRALFLHAELKGATMLRAWEGNFGLLPQPKYDEEQENYNSNVFSSCLSFCIPQTNMDLERTGIIVDYLTYESYKSLLPRYYDIHVSLKALGKQESIDVLALIRGTRGCEVAVPFGWASELNSKLNQLAKSNELSIASTIAEYKDMVVANINATYKNYPALNHAN